VPFSRLASVLVAIVATGANTTAALPAAQTQVLTSIHLYAPFNGGVIAARIRVGQTARGYCWTSSLADARSDAFRYFVGNYIHDPCFANEVGSSRFVLCPLYQPTSKVLRIDLTKPLPANHTSGNPTRYAPWAVQLASGKWCEFLTGVTGQTAGMRINYGCTGGGILIGNPQRGSPTWSIFYASSFKANQFQRVALRSAWW
jgi:hypothetical protein